MLAHNPAGAVYSRYIRNAFLSDESFSKLKSIQVTRMEQEFKAVEINVGYHPDGFRIDKTASPLNRYTRWKISGEGRWKNPTPVCFDLLPQDGWLKVDSFDWNKQELYTT